MKSQRKTESGQVIVLLVLGIVALLAAGALAIDGGRVLAERRSLQNVADSSALAGAFAKCNDQSVSSAALTVAAQNGYDNNGVSNIVEVNNPPSSGPHTGEDEYIEVMITSELPSGFAGTVNENPLRGTTRAVASCLPGSGGPVGGGNGLMGLNPSERRTIRCFGNADVNVINGGIFDNSNHSRALEASGNCDVTADSVSVVGDYNTSGNADINPEPTTGVPAITDPLAGLVPPSNPGGCASYSLGGNGTDTIGPGCYQGISISGNGNLTMTPGTYYLDGGAFQVSGNGVVNASEVFIYIASNHKFSISGNGNYSITAPTSGAWEGMMLFMDPSNTRDVEISGNGSSSSTGTIYAPSSEIEVSGNGGNFVLHAQIIGDKISVSGNGDITVDYDEDSVYQGGGGNPVIQLGE